MFIYCDNTPPADPNQPNNSWTLESSSGFSHLWPGLFHIPLPIHKIHNREGGRKRRTNNHRLGLASSARREKSVTLLCILWANTSVYSRGTSTKSQRMLTQFFALLNSASSLVFLDFAPTFVDCSRLPSVLFCWLRPSVPFS